MIPHVTNEIKRRIMEAGRHNNADVVIVEVGGTVGDIEGLPFLEAIRQMRKDVGRNHTFYVHVTLLPWISGSNELKTKPTQHSVRELRSIGIQPDMIVCRLRSAGERERAREDRPLHRRGATRGRAGLHCRQHLRSPADAGARGGRGLHRRAHWTCTSGRPTWPSGARWSTQIHKPKPVLNVALVGKYVELEDAYYERARVAAARRPGPWTAMWRSIGSSSENLERPGAEELLAGVDGILVPGGFGYRGIEGKIVAAAIARENRIPYLGLCLGMQVMCIEFARNVLGLTDANSTEFNPKTANPVISLMPDQQRIEDMGGTMRLGLFPCELVPGTHAAAGLRAGDAGARAAPSSLGVQQPLPAAALPRPGCASAAYRPMGGWWRSPSWRRTSIPGCSARSSTRNSARARTGAHPLFRAFLQAAQHELPANRSLHEPLSRTAISEQPQKM